MLTFGELFAGIGGISLGFERAGMIPKWHVELDDYATIILEKHWPHVAEYIGRLIVEAS
jgi:DNA (cytosine-5)-methyltransferase 1